MGYLTEASYAVSTRFGAINSPWWTFAPERVDYLAQPTPLAPASADGSGEFYVWAGAKLRLRAYNAFLQGQFRDSVHTLSSSDVNHVIGEAWPEHHQSPVQRDTAGLCHALPDRRGERWPLPGAVRSGVR